MKILVTGGLGFLGSWITESLIRSGHEVTTFSRQDRETSVGYTFPRLFGSVEIRGDLESAFAQQTWDVVIHLASVNDNQTLGYYSEALTTNTLGTRNLLSVMSQSTSKHAHLIYFSTFQIYGSRSGTFEEDKVCPSPKNDYASTHLFAEHYIRQLNFSHGTQFTIFRLTNGYGTPKDKNSLGWDLVLNDLVRMAHRERVIKLNSNGLAQRDFIWLADVCEAVEKSIVKGSANGIFNLGSGTSHTILEVAQIVKETFESCYHELIEIYTNDADPNTGEDLLNVSIAKLQNWIEFRPQNKLAEEAAKAFAVLENH